MTEDEARPLYSATDQRDAIASIKKGYSFPALPAPSSTWNSDYVKFTNEFSRVIIKRHSDHKIAGSDAEEIQQCYDALIAVLTACTARDIDSINCYHRMILEAKNPGDIRRCVNAFHQLAPAKSSDMITIEHVAACKVIREAVDYWDYHWKPLRLVERVMDEMILFAMQHVERSDEIAVLIRQNITSTGRITAILEDFGTRNIMMAGAL